MNDFPNTTLFMLMSVDGKISTGKTDDRDFDKDLPNIDGVKDGLNQYYKLQQETDLFSFNTGRVMEKVGWNDINENIKRSPVSFIIVDNKPHLTNQGVKNLIKSAKKIIIVTNNKNHPANLIDNLDLEIINYDGEIDFIDLFKRLKQMGIDNLTIQSGGEMNANLLRNGLINNLSIVVAPVLVGGRETPTIIDGESLITDTDLIQLKSLELLSAAVLENSYFHLKYKVNNLK